MNIISLQLPVENVQLGSNTATLFIYSLFLTCFISSTFDLLLLLRS